MDSRRRGSAARVEDVPDEVRQHLARVGNTGSVSVGTL
jgi:hypothetical protein